MKKLILINIIISVFIISIFSGCNYKNTVSKKNNVQLASIFQAIDNNDIKLLDKIISKNSKSINSQNKYGDTPLIYALKMRKFDIANELLNKNANVNVIGDYRDFALVEAIKTKNVDIINRIIQKGADVNYNNGEPLYQACITKNCNIVKLLIDNKVNIKLKYIDNCILYTAVSNNSLDIAKLLIDNGANPNEETEGTDESILFTAIWNKNLDMVKLLVEKGADINYLGGSNTSLELANRNDNKDIYNYLLSKGADVKKQGEHDAAVMVENDNQEMNKENPKPSPAIGMTKDEVLNSSWGKPEKINKTITANGTSEQWVYSGYRYIYFDNNVVTCIQDSE